MPLSYESKVTPFFYPNAEIGEYRTRPYFKFGPQDLFVQGEQGVFYDPSDLTTLYQDAAGTTPVTAVGQPVGLMLDKSGNDNHATQTTSAARPLLGRVPVTGRRNFYDVDSENPELWGNNIGTSTFTVLSSIGQFESPVEVQGVDGNVFISDIPLSEPDPLQNTLAVTLYLKKGSNLSPSVLVRNTVTAIAFTINWNTDGTVASVSEPSVSYELYQDGVYAFKFTYTRAEEFQRVRVYPSNGTTNGSVVFCGIQIEYDEITPYQHVISDLDVTEAGVRDAWYLQGDGVDDFMLCDSVIPTVGGSIVSAFDVQNDGLIYGSFTSSSRWYIGANTIDEIGCGWSDLSRSTLRGGVKTVVAVNSLIGLNANVSIYQNSAELVSATSTSAPNHSLQNYLFANNSSGSASLYAQSKMFGIVALNKALTDSERIKTEQWLASKAGVSI